MAYVGIGRALLRQEKIYEAMEYLSLPDDINYSKAFQLYRRWIEDTIIWIFTSFFLIITVPIVIGKVKNKRWQGRMKHNVKVDSDTKRIN